MTPDSQPKKLTKRERAEQERLKATSTPKVNSPKVNRRFIIRTTVGVMAMIATSVAIGEATGLAHIIPRQAKENPTNRKLREWNDQTRDRPSRYNTLAPEISRFAIEYFAEQMGYGQETADMLNSRFIYHPGILNFRQAAERFQTCDDQRFSEADQGITLFHNNEVHINLQRIYQQALLSVNRDPATGLFVVSHHEAHHAGAKRKRLPQPTHLITPSGLQPIEDAKGFVLLAPDPSRQIPGKNPCETLYGVDAEEALVVASQIDKLSPLNIDLSLFASEKYTNLGRVFRTKIVGQFFNGNLDELIKQQQSSDAANFYSTVGRSLSRNSNSLNEGVSAVSNILR